MNEKKCDKCGELTSKKNLGKINKKYLCKKCKKELRINHRQKTIESEGIKEDLNKLDNKIRREKGYGKKYYAKRMGKPVKDCDKKDIDFIPKIKGSKIRKEKTNSYITLNDRQALFRLLIKRGLNHEEAKERISDLIKYQIQIRNTMKAKNKSEEEIKLEQQKLLEELWEY